MCVICSYYLLAQRLSILVSVVFAIVVVLFCCVCLVFFFACVFPSAVIRSIFHRGWTPARRASAPIPPVQDVLLDFYKVIKSC